MAQDTGKRNNTTSAHIIREILHECFEPLKNYSFLYFLTFWGMLKKPMVILKSALNESEGVAPKRDFRVWIAMWRQKAWDEIVRSLKDPFLLIEDRKYYNPVSFFTLTIALNFFVGSLLTPPFMQYLTGVKPVNHVDNYNEFVEKCFNLALRRDIKKGSDEAKPINIEETKLIEYAQGAQKGEYFKKVQIIMLILCISSLFSLFAAEFYKLKIIEPLIYNLYVLSFCIFINMLYELILKVISWFHIFSYNEDLLIVVVTTFVFGVVPAMYYVKYIKYISGKLNIFAAFAIGLGYFCVFVITFNMVAAPIDSVVRLLNPAQIDIDYGFNGLKFETSRDSIKGLTTGLLHGNTFIRKSDSSNDGLPNSNIQYIFYNKRLERVLLSAGDSTAGRKLLQFAIKSYGIGRLLVPPHEAVPDIFVCNWTGRRAKASFRLDSASKKSYLLLTSRSFPVEQ